MAINKNHEFEDLNGIKCAVVERNLTPARLQFLKDLLEYNGYTTVVVASPPPKAAAPKPATPATEGGNLPETPTVTEVPPAPELFTLGVTDSTFNATNAVFGRLLKTREGHVVTLAYWQQKEAISNDEVPYFQKKA
ncbi:MAG: hypothetical protein POELPBGB_03336 [Bacteroidia bacterium]|nr:hypothetical protein [Bacteroidia bacterium]